MVYRTHCNLAISIDGRQAAKILSKSFTFPKITGCVCPTLLTPEGVVEVYDSLPPICNNTLIGQVATTMQCSSQTFTVRWINVHLQSGGDDCALFAIAFAEALCAGRDPFILSFDQLQMRQNLKLCLERGAVTKFPESTRQKRGCRSRMRMSRKVYIYCTCRLPWNKGCLYSVEWNDGMEWWNGIVE